MAYKPYRLYPLSFTVFIVSVACLKRLHSCGSALQGRCFLLQLMNGKMSLSTTFKYVLRIGV